MSVGADRTDCDIPWCSCGLPPSESRQKVEAMCVERPELSRPDPDRPSRTLPVSKLYTLSDTAKAAISQAAVAIGHAVDVLEEGNVSGGLYDATALLGERYTRVLAAVETPPTPPESEN